MAYTTHDIAAMLKAAREAKGFSQRDLSARAAVPQSHISKIENGAVDLRLSSLIALARVLDLELALVPRNIVPAVQSMARSSGRGFGNNLKYRSVLKEIRNVADFVATSSNSPLSEEEADALQHNLLLLSNLRLTQDGLNILKAAMQSMKTYLDHPEDAELVREAVRDIRELRNSLVHGSHPQSTFVRPAYSLEEDADG
jgi:transcriptional regulator with XRE-family HTH domain